MLNAYCGGVARIGPRGLGDFGNKGLGEGFGGVLYKSAAACSRLCANYLHEIAVSVVVGSLVCMLTQLRCLSLFFCCLRSQRGLDLLPVEAATIWDHSVN